MPDDADRFLRREQLHRPVQVRDVLDEVIEAARSHPLRIAVPAEVERHRAARQERREQVERASVIQPAVQEHGHLALAALDAMKLQPADVQEAVVHEAIVSA